MVGKKQLQIDARQFVQGLATTDYVPDGGMGTSSYNISPIATVGIIRATPSLTIDDSEVVDQPLASCEDPRSGTTSNQTRLIVDDGGRIYNTSDGENISLGATPSSTSGYTRNLTDMAVFQGKVYITKTSNVVQVTMNNVDNYTLDETWWTGTKGQSSLTSTSTPHPMVVFERKLWIADSADLHSVDESLNVSADALSFNTNDRIQALGIDPSTGLMMISVVTVADTDDVLAARYFVCLYDGYSAQVRRRIPVEAMVTSFKYCGGQVFVTYGQNVGVWNGAGITFLRRLDNWGGGDPVYFMQATVAQNTYYVANGTEVLAYGEIVPGKKVWYPVFKNQVDSGEISFLVWAGNDSSAGISQAVPTNPIFLWAKGDANIYGFAPRNTTVVGSGVFFSPNINFERPIFIRRVRIFTTGITTTTGLGSIGIVDETGTTRTPAVSTFVVTAAQTPRRNFDFDFGGLKVQTAQLKVGLDTQAFGFIRAIIYYDVAE